MSFQKEKQTICWILQAFTLRFGGAKSRLQPLKPLRSTALSEWDIKQSVEAPVFHAAFLQSIFPCLLCMRDFITPANITADYDPPMLFRNTCTRSEILILKHETLSRLARQRRGGGAPAWGRDRLPAPEEGGVRRTDARPRQPPERSGPNGRHLLHKWVRAIEERRLLNLNLDV